MPKIRNLNEQEVEILRQCIHASYAGPFFPDWEFHTIFGVERDFLNEILKSWSNIDDQNRKVEASINNSFNNLLGYPHKKQNEWPQYITASPHEVFRIFKKWRGENVENYFGSIF